MNQARFRRHAKPIFGYQAWCREVVGVEVGELSQVAIASVLRRYSAACFETAKRKRAGEQARYPRRKHALVPLRWRHGNFTIQDRRIRVAMASGAPRCWLRLSRPVPYPREAIRSVTVLMDGGRLVVDVTAGLEVEDHDLDPGRVAGVDLGIILPIAARGPEAALLVSGRAVRAEHRLHLADTKARQRLMDPKREPRRGQQGSRRWRKLRAKQRAAEAASQRRVRQAQHEAARTLVDWAIQERIGRLVVGDPQGITNQDAGPVHNRRLRTWGRTYLMGATTDKAEQAGIHVERVDERGTSSTCPHCRRRVAKPSGRNFACPHCEHHGHRELIAAHNIAATRGGHITTSTTVVEHRRVGTPTQRRDRRRHHMDRRRSCPASGRPAPHDGESLANPGEDQPTTRAKSANAG